MSSTSGAALTIMSAPTKASAWQDQPSATARAHAPCRPSCRTSPILKVSSSVPLHKASISFKGKDWTVPRAFQGEHLAIRPQAKDGTFGIYFGANLIKTIDLNP